MNDEYRKAADYAGLIVAMIVAEFYCYLFHELMVRLDQDKHS